MPSIDLRRWDRGPLTTRKQHYVWRYYLEAWANDDGKVPFARNGEIKPASHPINIMAERDFYKLPRIDARDASFLDNFIGLTQGPALQSVHRNFVSNLAYVSRAHDHISRSDSATEVERRYALAAVIEIEENLQGGIEQEAKPLLEQLRKKQTSFIDDDRSAISFYHYLAQQYFRTKRIRTAIGRELDKIDADVDYGRLSNIVCHIAAVNFGSSLFIDRNHLNVAFLEAGDGAAFVTGDQPVVNLMGTGDEHETSDIAMFYPLTPELSCLIAPEYRELGSFELDSDMVNQLNVVVAWESMSFVVGNSQDALRRVIQSRPCTRPPSDRVLEALIGHWKAGSHEG